MTTNTPSEHGAPDPDATTRRTEITQTRSGAAGPDTVVSLHRDFATTVDDLWDACTTPERIARWFAPVSGDLRLGGRYQIKGNAGGTIETCEPPREFSATWEFGGNTSNIEVRVEAAGGGARLTIEHRAEVADEFWTTYGPGATGVGWDLGMLGLHNLLATGAKLPIEESEWVTTDEYRTFVAAISARWAEASIAAGTPEAAARAAEANTTAFYTGEEAPAADA